VLLDVQGVRKTYAGGAMPVEAVRGVDLEMDAGEFVALMGPSGCGKSTLLHLCGAMDRPTAGRVLFEGSPLDTLDDDGLTRLRRERIGFVFQFFNLLPTLTVAENVTVPLLLAGVGHEAARRRGLEWVERVDLGARAGQYPQQLSGGEMQRCAIARALVHAPALLIADEPTGSLDSANGDAVLLMLRELAATTRVAVLLATHAPGIAASADRILHLLDGRVQRVEETRGAARRAQRR
jgi:putative ABC transport system ATP-binding protein